MRQHIQRALLPALVLVSCFAVLALTGCSKQADPPAAPPPQVVAMQVIQRTATIMDDQVAQVSAFREVALRAQVTGWVQSILFQPGQRVKENEVLFVIDPRPYEADVAEAMAAVADAESALANTRQDVARYEPLLPDNAIPRATYDAAVAAAKSAQAAVEQRKAAAGRLRLNLQNTKVRSPVTGQIGRQQVEIGALATSDQTVLATVSTLDPVFANFSIPEADYVRYIRSSGSREAAATQARADPIRLILPDGSEYEHPGAFDFAERAISSATGTLALRAKFPNPEGLLRPGMNVRVRMVYGRIPDALLVPQRAVTEILGKQFVTVIGQDNKAGQRPVTLGDRIGELWIVTSGLKADERIIVDGAQKAPPGTVVAPTMITEAQLSQPPAAAQAPAQSPAK